MNPDDLQELLRQIVGTGLRVVAVRDSPTGIRITVEVPKLDSE